MKKFKGFIIILCFDIIIIACLLYGFEYYLKLTDPFINKLPYDTKYCGRHWTVYNYKLEKPNGNYTWGNLFEYNKYRYRGRVNFRGREFSNPKHEGIYRIMVLGDSLTWGTGLAVEERYTNICERYLNKHFGEKKFEVLNFGIRGASTILERDVLREYKDQVKPDLIVVGFCKNDPQPKSANYSIERENFNRKYKAFIDSLPQRFKYIGLPYTGDVVKKAICRFVEMVGIIPRWQVGMQRAYDKSSKEWREFEEALRDIKKMSDEMELPAPIFTILNQGTYADRPTDYSNPDKELKIFLRWFHQAEEAASQIGFTTYNHEKEFASQLSGEILALNVFDSHPSAKMNQIYAKKLFETVVKIICIEDTDYMIEATRSF